MASVFQQHIVSHFIVDGECPFTIRTAHRQIVSRYF
ncbi:hypothetical protein HmCmsJML047_00510 [Escherichia coli]|nr:hypothetical protein HmCmsJML035_03190 [Escherichia coli]GCV63514.1 hypothetical protein HmCmsJML047_00510 [Escherichia coli]GCY07015.1 hypothetical protein HmCmsJML077_02873 [Escherichia coli]